jgi:hypothetical protein
MLQWLYIYVANVCSKCFTCFRLMLQVFHLDVAYVLDICCKCLFNMFHYFRRMLQMCYLDVIVVIHICAEVLSCCNISRRRKRAHTDAVIACVAVPTCMRISRHEVDISRHEVHNCVRRRTSMQEAGLWPQQLHA